jgi:hypothetical protein
VGSVNTSLAVATLLLLTLSSSCRHGERKAEAPPAPASTEQPVTFLGPNEPCTSDAQCEDGFVCEGCGKDDRTCIPGCRSDEDCANGESCQPVQCIRCPCPPLCGQAG